jgi:tungstate transport system ATP-binding protein
MSDDRCLLELREVRVDRGEVEVLQIPSFRLGAGELVSIIGPNGSGKSTLLLTLMSLLPRAAGELRWRGREVRNAGEVLACRRRMAMVFQEPLLLDATVHDNVAAGLRLRRLPGPEVQRRVEAALRRFHLSGLARRSARHLSGGEARRVNLARALAVDPEVVLLDEPFVNLDLPTRQAIVDDLEQALRQAGTAAVLVTHDQTEALRLSSRIVVMNAGRIVQSDLPSVVMNDPVNEFVAACVGMETILPGVVRRSERGEIVAEVAGRQIDAVGEGEVDELVYCCVRPESVVIEAADGRPRASSVRNAYAARVTAVVAAGPTLKVRLDCGFPLVASVTAESFTLLGLTEGKEVVASFKATSVHVIRHDGAPR